MVTKQVGYGLVLLGFLLMLGEANGGELNLTLQQNHAEWGQPITAQLIAAQAGTALAEIDLTPLQDDFVVTVAETVRENPPPEIQTLELELNPRRSGVLTIPALALGGLQSPPQTVNISSAMIQDTPLAVEFNISEHHVWQRQQVLVTVEIKSPDRFFNLETEPFDWAGFETRPIIVSREPLDSDPRYRSRIQLGWAIFPLLSGEFNLELPMIRYVRGGQTQKRLYFPRINIQVRDLPAYIPPNMPVAKVNVTSSIVSNGLLRTGHLAYWKIHLHVDGTLAYWLPPVLRNVRSSERLEFFPAETQPVMQINSRGAHAEITHQVPFKVLRMGNANLPPLRVQYFDPEMGRIETVYHQPPQPFAWSSVALVIIALVVVLLLGRLGRWIGRRYIRYRNKQSAMDVLREAKTASEIQLGLRQVALSEGWPANLTLADFSRYWQQRYDVPEELKHLFTGLSGSLYGGRRDNLPQELSRDLVQQLNQTRGIRHPRQSLNSFWDVKNLFMRPYRQQPL